MARPLRLHVRGVLYHVMSRGNGKQRIFLDAADYEHFLRLLEQAIQRFQVECCGYCLMPTHYHTLLRPRGEPLSRMMQQLNSSYSQYFNRTHSRVGHVFQGRFKSLMVDTDNYFLALLRYTMLNPVESQLTEAPSGWPWSSYRATAGLCAAPSFLTLGDIWATFDYTDVDRARRRFVEYVAASDGNVPSTDGMFFGSRPFVEGMAPKLEEFREDRELRYADRFAARPALATLMAAAADEAPRRRAMREAFFRHAYTLREIADVVGRHPGTIWRWIRDAEPRSRQLVAKLQRLER